MLGSFLSGLGGLASGASSLFGKKKDNSWSKQVMWAKNGLRWIVNSGKKLGLHPLATIGANTVSTPYMSAGSQGSDSTGYEKMGAGISDMIKSFGTKETKQLREMDIESKKLDNQNKYIENQILQEELDKIKGVGKPDDYGVVQDIYSGVGSSDKQFNSETAGVNYISKDQTIAKDIGVEAGYTHKMKDVISKNAKGEIVVERMPTQEITEAVSEIPSYWVDFTLEDIGRRISLAKAFYFPGKSKDEINYLWTVKKSYDQRNPKKYHVYDHKLGKMIALPRDKIRKKRLFYHDYPKFYTESDKYKKFKDILDTMHHQKGKRVAKRIYRRYDKPESTRRSRNRVNFEYRKKKFKF